LGKIQRSKRTDFDATIAPGYAWLLTESLITQPRTVYGNNIANIMANQQQFKHQQTFPYPSHFRIVLRNQQSRA
jgi:hypothetical protein